MTTEELLQQYRTFVSLLNILIRNSINAIEEDLEENLVALNFKNE